MFFLNLLRRAGSPLPDVLLFSKIGSGDFTQVFHEKYSGEPNYGVL